MKYLIAFLLTISSAQAEAPSISRATFLVSCERTYFKIVAEYFEESKLNKLTKGFTDSCKTMSMHYNLEDIPLGLGCSLAIKQMKITKPELPEKQVLYDKFCKDIAEF